MSTLPTRRTHAFTLVELLVVIGIIALLISILLPSLSRAKEMAKQSECLSNMRQLCLASYLYSLDNHDAMIPIGFNAPVGIGIDTLHGVRGNALLNWNGEMVQDGAGNFAFDPAYGLLGHYTKTAKVFECPTSLAQELKNPNISTYTPGGSMATTIAACWLNAPKHFSFIHRGSETVLFGDGVYVDTSTGNVLLYKTPVIKRPSAGGTTGPDWFIGRHLGGKGSVGFVDGHAEAKLAQPRLKSSYPGTVTQPEYDLLQKLHIGPVVPDSIDAASMVSPTKYAQDGYDRYDFYWWLDKTAKDVDVNSH